MLNPAGIIGDTKHRYAHRRFPGQVLRNMVPVAKGCYILVSLRGETNSKPGLHSAYY